MSKFMQWGVVVLLFLCGQSLAWKPEIGEIPGPLNNMEYTDGTPIDLSKFRGKPLLIYFGGDWCPPCVRQGMPTLIEISKKYQPKGLQVLYANSDDNKMREAKSVEAARLGWSIAMFKLSNCPPNACNNINRDVGDFGKVYTYPMVILIDSSGVVVERIQSGPAIQGNLESKLSLLKL